MNEHSGVRYVRDPAPAWILTLPAETRFLTSRPEGLTILTVQEDEIARIDFGRDGCRRELRCPEPRNLYRESLGLAPVGADSVCVAGTSEGRRCIWTYHSSGWIERELDPEQLPSLTFDLLDGGVLVTSWRGGASGCEYLLDSSGALVQEKELEDEKFGVLTWVEGLDEGMLRIYTSMEGTVVEYRPKGGRRVVAGCQEHHSELWFDGWLILETDVPRRVAGLPVGRMSATQRVASALLGWDGMTFMPGLGRVRRRLRKRFPAGLDGWHLVRFGRFSVRLIAESSDGWVYEWSCLDSSDTGVWEFSRQAGEENARVVFDPLGGPRAPKQAQSTRSVK